MARKRKFSTFNLSFLDIMSCGFGAVVLIFLMIDHAANVHSEAVNEELLAEVNMLAEEIRLGEANLVRVRNTIATVDQRMVEAQGRARQIIRDIDEITQQLELQKEDTLSEREHRNRLLADIKALEEEKKRLEAEGQQQQGQNVRRFIGDGDRQYLTGLKLGGNRVLILLDSSASMLDYSIVNILRRRNMADEVKIRSEKWQRTLSMVEWLSAQLPRESWYQIYSFNTEVSAVVPGSLGEWLEIKDAEKLDEAVGGVRKLIPAGGTNMEKAFRTVAELAPLPDNIILITDGLPTQGSRMPSGNTISGRDRERLFERALNELPKGIPVNVVLTPLEGDPMAASHFWRLAVATGGSFLSPSRDWP